MMGMLSTGGKFLGKAAMPIAIGAEALSVLTAKDKMRAGVTGAAGLGGMWAGAKLGAMGGAMLGSIVPVIGTGIGAAVGGILGGAIGYFGTKWAAGKIYDASTQKKNPQIQQQQQQQVKVIKEETKKIITRQPIKLILDGRVLTETVLEFMDEKTVRRVGAYG
jgi:phage tail tape-measure protein